MEAQELIAKTGQHLLFFGIDTYSWSTDQFKQAAQFAKAHGIDALLIKVADGVNTWYGGINGWHNIRQTILAAGVGAIPYSYSYGNKFGSLDTEIDIMTAYMQDSGIMCANMEAEWNGQVAWAQHLCSRMQNVPGTFLVSTWANLSSQNWEGVIRALAPCAEAFMPQQYNNYLATFWGEFSANGASFLQPTVHLTQEFGANDPVAIARNAYNQRHTAISVWYYETAIADPGLLDAVLAAFPKSGGDMTGLYGPGKGDFDTFFTVGSDGSWVCKKFNTILAGGNRDLYSRTSIDGSALPLVGLPRTNELYQRDADGYAWSVQFCERGLIVYDPEHKRDSQPGCGSSYFGKYQQFMHLDPAYQTVVVEKLLEDAKTDLQHIAGIADKYRQSL